jgi:two-component system NtrC family sensor kinase
VGDAIEFLRANAVLLIRRERELHELRQKHGRIGRWLNVFDKLPLSARSTEVASLLEQWVDSMVSDLAFQVAAAYVWDVRKTEGPATLRLLTGVAQAEIETEVVIEQEVRACLGQNANGLYIDGEPSGLRALAETLNLSRFYWSVVPSRDRHFLLVAGYAPGAERFHAVIAEDQSHFVLLASHVVALVDNVLLIAELDREKSELEKSNSRLDVSVKQLRQAQRELIESGKALAAVSRRAGMADIATGVLHNVGNVLNSVSVSSEVIAQRMRTLKVGAIGKIAELLQAKSSGLSELLGFEQAERVLAYLRQLAVHLGGERDELLKEVAALKEHVEHTKAIIGKQQAFAGSFDMAERCNVHALVDDAITLTGQALRRHGVRVSREYQQVPELFVDRHKVLQILVNLLKNAQDALLERAEGKLIVVRIENSGTNTVRIAIEDNGTGITPDDSAKLFRYGFTTKKDGHGFGLHTSAIAARDLGGRLSGESEGRGKGARFVLDLPVRSVADSAA